MAENSIQKYRVGDACNPLPNDPFFPDENSARDYIEALPLEILNELKTDRDEWCGRLTRNAYAYRINNKGKEALKGER